MKTLAERLKFTMDRAGISQAELASKVGVSQPAIWRLVAGQTHTTRKLVEIAHALGVSPEWLSTGKEALSTSPNFVVDNFYSSRDTDADNSFRIEVLDLTVSAGPGLINSEFVEILRSVEYSANHARQMFNGRRPEQIRIINVRGDSMLGTIEPGDLLFVDISIQHFDGDGIYAFLYDETAHVKRLQKMKDKLLVISDNKSYAPWDPIEKDEMNRVFIFGKVIGSMPQTYRIHG